MGRAVGSRSQNQLSEIPRNLGVYEILNALSATIQEAPGTFFHQSENRLLFSTWNWQVGIMPLGEKHQSLLTQGALFNRKQIAKFIGVSERTISNMVRRRQIPMIKFGRNVRFDPVRVRKALEKFEIREL